MNTNRVLVFLATASAAVAFLLWMLPYSCYSGYVCGISDSPNAWFNLYNGDAFSAEALWVLIFALASFFLLLVRAGNRR
jgi:hypothetical protein